MNNEIMSEELKKLFLDDLLKDNFTYSNHNFSLRYKFQKSKIINNLKADYLSRNEETICFQETKVRIPLKHSLKYILIIIVLMAILGFTAYRHYSGIVVREYDVFSLLSAKYDEGSPQVLTERFYIDMDLSEYELEILDDDELVYWIQYNKDGKPKFDIMQTTLKIASDVRLNTENAIIMPTNVSVNDWNGMYFQAYDGSYIYFFNCGDYVMSYSGNLDKNEIEKLVKSTKFIQK